MNTILLTIPVVAVTILQGPTAAQPLDPRTEADAYAVYASVLSHSQHKPPVIVVRETEGLLPSTSCSALLSELTGDWREAAQDFRNKNARTWLLQPAGLGSEYRLVTRAEILADDVRLANKYPGRLSNAPAPGSIEYVAVSAVGFNAARTKALVHVRGRTWNGLSLLIRSDGRWVRDPKATTCGGIA